MRTKQRQNKTALFLIAICAGLIIVLLIFNNLLSTYSREAYVENNNGEELIFSDFYGHLWGWGIETKEEYNLTKWDKVILTFNNNGTDEDVTDDIIIKVEKK